MKYHEHPAYNDSIRRAAEAAYNYKGASFSVYFDGAAIHVLSSHAEAPANATCVCVAQYWADTTVQLRFAGAHSEWVKF